MSPPWALIQHVDFEGPGLIAAEAARRGIEIGTVRTYRGEALPQLGEIAGLVVLGGPVGVHGTAAHPNLIEEQRLLAAAVGRGLPVLGVCLGAQLLAAALGAEVYPGPESEIGAGGITLTPDGRADPVLGPAGQHLPVLHWHGDTFDLPDAATHLAANERYTCQAFRVGDRTYGLQFHTELDHQLADELAPHLPSGIGITDTDRRVIEDTGRGVIARFFDAADAPATRR